MGKTEFSLVLLLKVVGHADLLPSRSFSRLALRSIAREFQLIGWKTESAESILNRSTGVFSLDCNPKRRCEREKIDQSKPTEEISNDLLEYSGVVFGETFGDVLAEIFTREVDEA